MGHEGAESDMECIARTIDEQIKQVHDALDHFLNAEFKSAMDLVQERAVRGYPYHNLGKSFLFFIKAVFTFDQDDISRTVEQIDNSIRISSGIADLKKRSILSRITDAVRISEQASLSKEADRLIAHCELIVSELTLLRALLLIFTDSREGWILMLKQSLHMYQSYSFYSESLKGRYMNDSQYRAGVLLGNGAFNFILPLLPPTLAQLFAFFGYKGNTKLGLEQLRESAGIKDSIRSPLSSLVVLLYHLFIAYAIPTRERFEDEKMQDGAEWFRICSDIIGNGMRQYPRSPIYRYFKGRFLFVQHKTSDAIQLFEETMKLDIEWPQLKHAGYWEVCLCSLYSLDWERGYKYSKVMAAQNRWSKAFYTYLEAVFLWSMDESNIENVKGLLCKVPELMKRVAGKTIPIEKFALQRAKMIVDENRLPFHAALEIALVWDGIQMISADNRETIRAMMDKALSCQEVDNERRGQMRLTLATIHRLNGDYETAIRHCMETLKMAVPHDAYCTPLANLELSHVYLALGSVDKAEHYYEQSVSYKHYYLVKKFTEVHQARVKIEIDEMRGR